MPKTITQPSTRILLPSSSVRMMISPHVTGHSAPSPSSRHHQPLIQLSPLLREAETSPKLAFTPADSRDNEPLPSSYHSTTLRKSDLAYEDRRSRFQRRPAPLRRVSSHRQDLVIAIAQDQEVSSLIHNADLYHLASYPEETIG
jgi:hypothetical protein